MTNSNEANPPGPKGLPSDVGRLFQKYFNDPQSPSLEEVGRLAEDLLLRNAELESKVFTLRKMVQQLEAYRDRYVDLYELAPVGYVTLDDEGYVQEINIAGSQLLGDGSGRSNWIPVSRTTYSLKTGRSSETTYTAAAVTIR